jgi:hypothetical protein
MMGWWIRDVFGVISFAFMNRACMHAIFRVLMIRVSPSDIGSSHRGINALFLYGIFCIEEVVTTMGLASVCRTIRE